MMNSNRGFTLLEVLVAMLIMLGAVMVVSNAWSGNVARVEKSRINTTTALLLQRKMTEVELKYKDKSITEIPEEESGDFGAAFPQYSWQMKSKEFEMPNVADALIAREGGADQMLIQIMTQLTETMGKAIKEVSVTVIYNSKRTKSQLKNSVATYFVDYNAPLPFGGGGADGGGGGSGK